MLEWNVYTYNFNERQLQKFNVFDHAKFFDDCKQALKKYGADKAAFIEEVRSSLMYCYWSKCEWEIVISHFPPRPDFTEAKIDVYDQICLNWEIFVDYLWEHRSELKKRRQKS